MHQRASRCRSAPYLWVPQLKAPRLPVLNMLYVYMEIRCMWNMEGLFCTICPLLAHFLRVQCCLIERMVVPRKPAVWRWEPPWMDGHSKGWMESRKLLIQDGRKQLLAAVGVLCSVPCGSRKLSQWWRLWRLNLYLNTQVFSFYQWCISAEVMSYWNSESAFMYNVSFHLPFLGSVQVYATVGCCLTLYMPPSYFCPNEVGRGKEALKEQWPSVFFFSM